MRRKSQLLQKTCSTCGRPFAWRKKWAKVWDEVRYCSDRCRRRSMSGMSPGQSSKTKALVGLMFK
ncbi:DUF2256 domain-containing protein [uncultured Ruegeria sp.]|uniref:DUF2256 domain-containing protein n=1 Tax=uncultured Ruegeria sp. TaxID=259304 RepID=UPI002602F7EA|nr:DUF2256 domain-containing protein [uncultured Ruegeria sp.]